MREVCEGLICGLGIWRVRLAMLGRLSGGRSLWLWLGHLLMGGGRLGGEEGGVEHACVVEGAWDVLFFPFLETELMAMSRMRFGWFLLSLPEGRLPLPSRGRVDAAISPGSSASSASARYLLALSCF